MLDALLKEIDLQKNFLENECIETIYFGGGTPSVLSADEINRIIDRITSVNKQIALKEVTLETNPDDLSSEKIRALRSTPVNRFSIGIQSFFDEDLKWMNRAHNSKEAEFCIKGSQDAGFENLTIDLIYGYPLLSEQKWLSNINRSIGMGIPHISCYSMTVEPKTALASFIRKGEQPKMDDEQSAQHFLTLTSQLQNAGFEHYEISNFAKDAQYSMHNTNYWKGVKYLGIGPSAHSFDGCTRQWNIANNAHYITALSKGEIPAEKEILTNRERVNEYIMTSLRTMWGIQISKLEKEFSHVYPEIIKYTQQFIDKGWVNKTEKSICLTTEGKLYADYISSELFIEDEF